MICVMAFLAFKDALHDFINNVAKQGIGCDFQESKHENLRGA
jgi:hypothetical protein